MKALDTNVLLRFLLDDHQAQARRVRRLLEDAEASGERFLVTDVVVLELIWVLSAVYELGRRDLLNALSSLTRMPVLNFESHDAMQRLIALGAGTGADLPDLLIGLAAESGGAQTTLTFDAGLARTGLFELLRS